MTPACHWSVPCFQALTHVLENGRQLPLAKHVGMIERGRAALQRCQIMQRLKHLAAGFIAALVPGNQLV